MYYLNSREHYIQIIDLKSKILLIGMLINIYKK